MNFSKSFLKVALFLFIGVGIYISSQTFAIELNSGNIATYCSPGSTTCSIYNSSITYVASWTFVNYTGLHELGFGFYLTGLDKGAFQWLSGLTGLSIIADSQLTNLPLWIFAGLSNLQTLNLYGNQLTTLPLWIFSGLSNLQTLYLYGNKITTLPVWVFSGLSNLIYLFLFSNKLTTLPLGIFTGLSSLEYLDLGSDQLTNLPIWVFSGLSISTLILRDNYLTSLPAWVFSGLPNLQIIDLSYNYFTSLSDWIFSGLSNVFSMDLSYNYFTSLPIQVLSGLSSLRNLYLNNNYLTTLPLSLTTFSTLSYLGLLNNCLTPSLLDPSLQTFVQSKSWGPFPAQNTGAILPATTDIPTIISSFLSLGFLQWTGALKPVSWSTLVGNKAINLIQNTGNLLVPLVLQSSDKTVEVQFQSGTVLKDWVGNGFTGVLAIPVYLSTW